jgi:hypothetical protein
MTPDAVPGLFFEVSSSSTGMSPVKLRVGAGSRRAGWGGSVQPDGVYRMTTPFVPTA